MSNNNNECGKCKLLGDAAPCDECFNKSRLSGEALNLVDLNYFLYGCADPDYPNTHYMDAPEMQFFRDKVNMRRKGTGKIIITSTPAESGNEAHEFYKLWAKDKQ